MMVKTGRINPLLIVALATIAALGMPTLGEQVVGAMLALVLVVIGATQWRRSRAVGIMFVVAATAIAFSVWLRRS